MDWDNEEEVLRAMEEDRSYFYRVSPRLQDNEKVALLAVRNRLSNFKHVSSRLRKDEKFIKEMIAMMNLRYMSKVLVLIFKKIGSKRNI